MLYEGMPSYLTSIIVLLLIMSILYKNICIIEPKSIVKCEHIDYFKQLWDTELLTLCGGIRLLLLLNIDTLPIQKKLIIYILKSSFSTLYHNKQFIIRLNKFNKNKLVCIIYPSGKSLTESLIGN